MWKGSKSWEQFQKPIINLSWIMRHMFMLFLGKYKRQPHKNKGKYRNEPFLDYLFI